MAHVAKYQSGALGNMCGHYSRWNRIGKERENIDRTRTHLNYNLAPERDQVAFVGERIASLNLKRRPRKDAVVMCDCVLTMPRSLDPSREREFFEAGYAFLSGRYGIDNVVSAWVHKDETQPHMHFAWVPVTPDGRLSAKDVVSRKDLRTLHADMQRYVRDALGCDVEILLDEGKAIEKALSSVPQKDLDEARASLVRQAEREAEAMRAQVEDLRTEQRSIQAEIEAERERLERLRCACDTREREAERLECITDAVNNFEHARIGSRRKALDQVVSIVRQAITEAAARIRAQLSAAVRAVSLDAEQVRGMTSVARERAFDMHTPIPQPSKTPSLSQDVEYARRSSARPVSQRGKERGVDWGLEL